MSIEKVNSAHFQRLLDGIHQTTLSNLANYSQYQEEEAFLTCMKGMFGDRFKCSRKALEETPLKKKVQSLNEHLLRKEAEAKMCMKQMIMVPRPKYSECLEFYAKYAMQEYSKIVK